MLDDLREDKRVVSLQARVAVRRRGLLTRALTVRHPLKVEPASRCQPLGHVSDVLALVGRYRRLTPS